MLLDSYVCVFSCWRKILFFTCIYGRWIPVTVIRHLGGGLPTTKQEGCHLSFSPIGEKDSATRVAGPTFSSFENKNTEGESAPSPGSFSLLATAGQSTSVIREMVVTVTICWRWNQLVEYIFFYFVVICVIFKTDIIRKTLWFPKSKTLSQCRVGWFGRAWFSVSPVRFRMAPKFDARPGASVSVPLFVACSFSWSKSPPFLRTRPSCKLTNFFHSILSFKPIVDFFPKKLVAYHDFLFKLR